MEKLKVLDLFSGIGGFSLGLERTSGFETVAFCEIEEFPQKVLKKHWPNVPIYDDVRNLEHDGPIDIITGGYPCQPFSVAGKRKGKEDDRHLWPAMFDLIKKHRPTWVIGENVAGHISLGLDNVLADLESEGYQTRTFVIPAVAVDAKHRRDRVWIIAHSYDTSSQRQPKHSGTLLSITESKRSDLVRGNVSNTNKARLSVRNENGNRGQKRKGKFKRSQSVRIHSTERSEQWPTESGVGRVAHGISKRVDRLKGLGNAVVPQIPEMIGYAILEAEFQNRSQL